MTKHTLYTTADFTAAECCPIEGTQLARMVVEGGLGVCKNCGACEVQLDEYKSCEDFNAHNQEAKT